MPILNGLRRMGSGLWNSYGNAVDNVNELDARFATTGFGSFMHFVGGVIAAGILYGACVGGNGCSSSNSGSKSSSSSGCASSSYSGRVTTSGHIDTKCFKVNGVENCGFLETPNPNRIYFLTGLDDENEPRAINFRELDAKNVKFRRSDSGASGVVDPRNSEILEQHGEYKIGCVDLGVGEMCGVILPKGYEGIFCDPDKQAYNSQLLGITCYRQGELDTIVNTATRNGPKLVTITDTRGQAGNDLTARVEATRRELAQRQEKARKEAELNALQAQLNLPNAGYVAPIIAKPYVAPVVVKTPVVVDGGYVAPQADAGYTPVSVEQADGGTQ